VALINYLTTIRLDHGAVRHLNEDLAAAGITRPLVVTDTGCVAAGLLDKATAFLPKDLVRGVYDGTPSNPTEEAAEEALALYRAHDCDGLIAIGGGSPMDLAKAVAIMATHDEPLITYAAILGGTPKITAKTAPTVAIPTTAGTGSEVGRGAVISFRDGRKLGLLSPYLIPKRAVCDPDLTLGLPPMLTAATGMDAISHCIECYISPVDNPVAAAIALDGLERAWHALPRAVTNGMDREARREMMIAAFEGALAFQKGLGSVHALSHPLGALREFKLHHGTLNAVLLPPVLRFNEPVAGAKYEGLRRAMGVETGADVAHCVERYSAGLGLPTTLSAMGVPRQVLPAIARAALLDHTHLTNARPADEEDYLKILEEVF
jgi:4-hydroxybutyrate dehydrogenase